MANQKYDIYERTFKFAVSVAKYLNRLPNNLIIVEYKRQLIRSSASIGANLEEADGAMTKRDFINRLGISRREACETKYWLSLIRALDRAGSYTESLDELSGECAEIILILSTIIRNTKN